MCTIATYNTLSYAPVKMPMMLKYNYVSEWVQGDYAAFSSPTLGSTLGCEYSFI